MKSAARIFAFVINSLLLAASALVYYVPWQNLPRSHYGISILLMIYIISIFFRITDIGVLWTSLFITLSLLASFFIFSTHLSPDVGTGIMLTMMMIPLEVILLIAGYIAREGRAEDVGPDDA